MSFIFRVGTEIRLCRLVFSGLLQNIELTNIIVVICRKAYAGQQEVLCILRNCAAAHAIVYCEFRLPSLASMGIHHFGHKLIIWWWNSKMLLYWDAECHTEDAGISVNVISFRNDQTMDLFLPGYRIWWCRGPIIGLLCKTASTFPVKFTYIWWTRGRLRVTTQGS